MLNGLIPIILTFYMYIINMNRNKRNFGSININGASIIGPKGESYDYKNDQSKWNTHCRYS